MSRLLLIVFVATAGILAWNFTASAKIPGSKRTKHTSKLQAPMSANVELEGPAPTQAGDEYTLVGVVRSPKALKGVRLQWELGKVATLLEGALTQTVDLEPGQEVRARIRLRALLVGGAQVRLTASIGTPDTHFSSSARVKQPMFIIDPTGKKPSTHPAKQEEKRPKIFQ